MSIDYPLSFVSMEQPAVGLPGRFFQKAGNEDFESGILDQKAGHMLKRSK